MGADADQVITQIRPATIAVEAVAAGDSRLQVDPLSRMESFDSIAHGRDYSRGLMPRCNRIAEPWMAALEGVQVGAADPCEGGLDDNVTWSRGRSRHSAYRNLTWTSDPDLTHIAAFRSGRHVLPLFDTDYFISRRLTSRGFTRSAPREQWNERTGHSDVKDIDVPTGRGWIYLILGRRHGQSLEVAPNESA